MSNNPIISVRNISKMYRLFHSPHERFIEALHPFNKKYHREFWALKDISCDIPKGSTMGIIGRNGCGKSTLLQIICSVLQPTSGSVAVDGKISALLELGSGFNLDFTGRENVMLNGVLMGFTEGEMKDKIPVIESFADIGEFFDQPLKIYSSGMQVRLAFAAAINVDPEILIVDEALAVGDAKFQNKCFRKFLEFREAGRTILFVTHDMAAITKHCEQAILLENGTILKSGVPKEVVRCYEELLFTGVISAKVKSHGNVVLENDKSESPPESKAQLELNKFLKDIPSKNNYANRNSYNENEYRFGDKRGEIVDYLIICGEEVDPVKVRSGDTVQIYLKVKVNQAIEVPMIGFAINTKDGIMVNGSNTRFHQISYNPLNEGDFAVFKVSLELRLQSGDFFISMALVEKEFAKDTMIDIRHDLIHLLIYQEKHLFDGLAYLESDFQEVLRR